MERYRGLVLCADVDGTLINEENKVPKENLEAIEYFQAHGGKFTIASGRVPEAIVPVLPGLKLDFPCICQNGCGIYDFEKNTYISTVPVGKDAVRVAKEIEAISPDSGIEVMCPEGIYVVKNTFATERHLTYEKIEAKYADSLEEVTSEWLKILFANDPDEITKIQEAMQSSAFHKDFSIVRTHRYYYEIFNKGANKGNALKTLCRLCNIDMKNVIAVGDNDNDVAMLLAAGKSAVVQNASEYAKQNASLVLTRTNSEGAVAELIETL